MKLTLCHRNEPYATHEAELVSASGSLFQGGRVYKFKGPFPVDPGPFLYPPPPQIPAGADGGFYVYQRALSASYVCLEDGENFWMCGVEEATPEGFTLSPYGGGNLAAIRKLAPFAAG